VLFDTENGFADEAKPFVFVFFFRFPYGCFRFNFTPSRPLQEWAWQ